MSLWCAVAVSTQSTVPITPPTLRGIALRFLICSQRQLCFSVKGSRKWLRESNFKGHALRIRKPGTRTWIQMQIETDANSMAALKPLLLGH